MFGEKIKEETRDRAIQILVKMYNICKAKLPNGEPDDASLSQLVDKPLNLMLDKWELDEDTHDLFQRVTGERKGRYRFWRDLLSELGPVTDKQPVKVGDMINEEDLEALAKKRRHRPLCSEQPTVRFAGQLQP